MTSLFMGDNAKGLEDNRIFYKANCRSAPVYRTPGSWKRFKIQPFFIYFVTFCKMIWRLNPLALNFRVTSFVGMIYFAPFCDPMV